jgi:uncharacterized membrane protein
VLGVTLSYIVLGGVGFRQRMSTEIAALLVAVGVGLSGVTLALALDVRLVLLGVGSIAILYCASLAIVDVLQGDAAEPSQTAQVALSMFWGIVALVAIVVGLVGDVRELRYGGLALLGLSVAKVFAYDLSELDSLYRVLSFIAVGIMLLVGAYAYQRVRTAGAHE